MNRDHLLPSIRPQLPPETADQQPMAQFQLHVLRPILKLQNELILSIFTDYLAEARQNPQVLSEERLRLLIDQALTRPTGLKPLLIGIIVGHFTAEEYTFYREHRTEIHKRLTRFLSKRIADGLLARKS